MEQHNQQGTTFINTRGTGVDRQNYIVTQTSEVPSSIQYTTS